MQPSQTDRAGLDRRAFLRMAGVATVGLSFLVEACASPAPTERAAPPVATPPSATSSLPSYIPIQGPKPDLPGNEQGLQDGYFTYPKTQFKPVSQTPGLGSDVTAMTR